MTYEIAFDYEICEDEEMTNIVITFDNIKSNDEFLELFDKVGQVYSHVDDDMSDNSYDGFYQINVFVNNSRFKSEQDEIEKIKKVLG